MKRAPVFRTLLLCLTLVVALTVAQALAAQSGNLLTNPGFESPFEPVEGSTLSTVAQGWTAWSLESDQNMQPEYYPASDTTNGMATPRIHSGSDAQQYFTFFASHDAGVYQHVTGVTAGDQLSFSVYAYVWSSSGDDSDASDGTGELAVQVGIDPNGGTDPTSDSIVWSSPLSVVDQYAQHSVSAAAEGDAVTVFVRSTVNKVAMNNVVYLDDAELTIAGGEQGVATSEATREVSPVVEASREVTEAPTVEVVPPEVTEVPTLVPTDIPTEVPTELPTEPPTAVPTEAIPTEVPAELPTDVPTEAATEVQQAAVATEIPVTPSPSPTLNTTVFPLLFQYTVVRGDTVGQLATRFGSTVEAIIIVNQLGSDARIFETQVLMIPVQQLPPPTLPPTATPIASPTPIPTETPVVVQPVPTQPPTVVVVPSEAPIVVQPAAQEPPQAVATYVVQYGDSLSSIAVRFHITTRDLARANGIVNPNLIVIGQVLQIPPAGVPVPLPTPTQSQPTPIPQTHLYTVVRGDNLYRISVRFGVPLAALIEVNGIADPTRIFVGQVLIIP